MYDMNKNVFLDFPNSAVENVNEAKKYIENISVSLMQKGTNFLNSDIEFSKKINSFSFELFSQHKSKIKSFTICNNKEISKLRFDDEEGCLSEKDSTYVMKYIQDNAINSFTELVSQTYLLKRPSAKSPNEKLYYAPLY